MTTLERRAVTETAEREGVVVALLGNVAGLCKKKL